MLNKSTSHSLTLNRIIFGQASLFIILFWKMSLNMFGMCRGTFRTSQTFRMESFVQSLQNSPFQMFGWVLNLPMTCSVETSPIGNLCRIFKRNQRKTSHHLNFSRFFQGLFTWKICLLLKFFYFDIYRFNYKRLIHLRRIFFSPFSHIIICRWSHALWIPRRGNTYKLLQQPRCRFW